MPCPNRFEPPKSVSYLKSMTSRAQISTIVLEIMLPKPNTDTIHTVDKSVCAMVVDHSTFITFTLSHFPDRDKTMSSMPLVIGNLNGNLDALWSQKKRNLLQEMGEHGLRCATRPGDGCGGGSQRTPPD